MFKDLLNVFVVRINGLFCDIMLGLIDKLDDWN